MTRTDTPASGDTRSRLTLAAHLATISSAIVVTATSITTIATRSVAAIALFVSLSVAIGGGLYLITEHLWDT
ncbi:hypothetical protein HZS55_22005 [Halosimplex rubrum]|uniref:Uncharacterized protein n=1 Tax=Halosimplex rubrum TaxID=869889 RepID=A0A7D5P8A0_9EURY|nr:hypothetical protein [Halosimplex rubrum]QLH79802.1 hypothetical protein HZS55_22005 [Halosimplex rubrum]